jgi:transposase
MRDVFRFWLFACFSGWSVEKAYHILRGESYWQEAVPSPATVSRRLQTQEFDNYMNRFFRKLCRMALSRRLGDLRVLIIDSTAIQAPRDRQARWGYTAEGPFLGYKLHFLVNSRGVPLAAWVSQGHRSDHEGLAVLIKEAKQVLATETLRGRVKFVLADAGYDAEEHHYLISEMIGARFLAADNPRNRRIEEPTAAVRRAAFRLLKTQRGKKLMGKRSEIERVYSQMTDPGSINCEQLPRQIRGKKKVRRYLMAKAIQYTCGIMDNILSGRKARTMTYAA